ncbi:hypothetical protein AAIA72_15850 [Hahella sp. SMD15-11]|uniref:GNAT family N-acetyltransferase n=1 Tax=Thermohahella caldifontis TaxID=3142973 RepID=A0AB39UVN6_9GAMM
MQGKDTVEPVTRPAAGSRRGKLVTLIAKGTDTTPAIIREMWRLRCSYLDLKIPEAEDWVRFSGYCQRPEVTLVNFFDMEGNLAGFFTFAYYPMAHEGRKALIIHAKYYYVHREWRGHPAFTTAAWKLLPGILRRYGLRSIYFAALTFPTSFVSLARTFGRVYTIQETTTPPWERAVLKQFAMLSYGEEFDAEACVARRQNVPQGENRPQPESIRKLVERYEALNPAWREGVSLPIMMKLDLPTVWSTLSTSFRRMLRKFGR